MVVLVEVKALFAQLCKLPEWVSEYPLGFQFNGWTFLIKKIRLREHLPATGTNTKT